MFKLPSLYIGAIPAVILVTTLVSVKIIYEKIIDIKKINPDNIKDLKKVALHSIDITNLDGIIKENFYYCAEILQQFIHNTPGSAAIISKIGINESSSPMAMNIDNRCITSDRIAILIPLNCLDGSLTRNELKAVLAHEFAHGELKHMDKINMIAQYIYIFSTRVFLSQCSTAIIFALRSLWTKTIDPEELNKISILICLSGLISYAASAHSRKHEFEADRRSLRLSRNPQGLISAIGEIENMCQESLRSQVFDYTQSMELTNAFLDGLLRAERALHSIISTHPTKAERQQAISRIEIIDITDNKSLSDPNNVRYRANPGRKPQATHSGISLYNNKKPGLGFTLFIPEKDVATFNRAQTILR